MTGFAHYTLSEWTDQQVLENCYNLAADNLKDDLLRRNVNSLNGQLLYLLAMDSKPDNTTGYSSSSIKQTQLAVSSIVTAVESTCSSPNMTERAAREAKVLCKTAFLTISCLLKFPTTKGNMEGLIWARRQLVHLRIMENHLCNQIEHTHLG